MKMTLLDSIMHGPLKPWLLKPNVNDQLVKLLYKATSSTPSNVSELQSQLLHLVQDFPDLVQFLKGESLSGSDLPLVDHFYEIVPPQHTNAFQQFYYLLYRQESLRFFNALIIKIDALNIQDDKAYQLEKVFTSLRVLTIFINDTLKEYENEEPVNENVCYALNVARYMLIVLFFEIQDYFSPDLENCITPKFFFQNYLHLTYPPNFLIRSNYYYKNFFLRMYRYDRFEIDMAKKYLNEIKKCHLKDDERLLARYENGIFLYENGFSPDTVFQDFSIVNNESVFKEIKEEWLLQIDSLSTGYKRLNFINDQLDALQYLDDDRNNRISIPSRLFRFLMQQKEIYANQLSVEFKTNISLYQEQTFTINNPPSEHPDRVPDVPTDGKQNTAGPASSPIDTKNNKGKSPRKKDDKFHFGFKERRNPEKLKALKNCLTALCTRVDLLKEDKTSVDDFYNLLIADRVIPNKVSIYVGTESTNFRYIIDKLKPYFTNLTFSKLGWCGGFISKDNTPMNAQYFYSSKVLNPKEKETIDRIFKQMQ